jgi:alkaline phosphatase D
MRMFRHGVASGDPTTDSVVIWTRVSEAAGDSVGVSWLMATDRTLRDVVASGVARASAAADWTVHVDVVGLRPGRTYFYMFATQHDASPVGRARTLPPRDATRWRFAFVSCAKYNAGFFNAYGRIAERDDVDAVVHLGDYIYEASNTPPKSQTPGADIGRPFFPTHECRSLDDYRARYAQYRSDPDLQALHAAHSMIATLDDHELADGAWSGGADEHHPERDGAWERRRADALQARWEWLPARRPDPADDERVYRSIRIGELAELFLLDVRSNRDRPVAGPAMRGRNRSKLGAAQREWFLDALSASSAAWNLIGNPSPMASTWRAGLPDDVHRTLRALKLMHATEDAVDEDQWDGFPAERDTVLRALHRAGPGRSLVLAGDLHVSLAVEHSHPDDPAELVAVEVTTPSVTSQNLDEKLRLVPRTEGIAREISLQGALPSLRWCELESHGYTVVDLDAERAVIQWWYVDTVLERCAGERLGNEMVVPAGRARIVPVSAAVQHA